MRLTVCLEGNSEGRVLASVDMEELVKMTITDDVEKSNFNPQMLKACTDTSYECGYQQGRADAERDFQNSDYWNDYLAKVIADAKADAIEEFAEDILNKINFEEKWLFICKSNNADTNIMISALKTCVKSKAEQLKEHKK